MVMQFIEKHNGFQMLAFLDYYIEHMELRMGIDYHEEDLQTFQRTRKYFGEYILDSHREEVRGNDLHIYYFNKSVVRDLEYHLLFIKRLPKDEVSDCLECLFKIMRIALACGEPAGLNRTWAWSGEPIALHLRSSYNIDNYDL